MNHKNNNNDGKNPTLNINRNNIIDILLNNDELVNEILKMIDIPIKNDIDTPNDIYTNIKNDDKKKLFYFIFYYH